MKIAMMSAWNTDSGTAIHAETVGRAWIKSGHQLTVFSHITNDFHGTGFTGTDEDYVIRCFGTQKTGYFDSKPVLAQNFDLFVIQDLRMLPVSNLYRILPMIKSRSKLVNILYENHLPEEKWFFKDYWDTVVYFDRRQEFFKKAYPHAMYIPFPCFPPRNGNKQEARTKLKLPGDKNIIYLFCQRGYQPPVTELPGQLRETSVLLILTQTGHSRTMKRSDSKHVLVREEDALSSQRFDDYLFASDICVLHKESTGNLAVVSSTAYQSLGTGCPIMAPAESDFFKESGDEIIKYHGIEDLNRKLIEFTGNRKKLKKHLDSVKRFVRKHSPEIISGMFLR